MLHKSVLDAFIRILSVHQFARSQTMSKYFVNTTSIYDNVKYLLTYLKLLKLGSETSKVCSMGNEILSVACNSLIV